MFWQRDGAGANDIANAKFKELIESKEFWRIKSAVEGDLLFSHRYTEPFASLLSGLGIADPDFLSAPEISQYLGVDSRSIVHPVVDDAHCEYLGGHPEEFAVYKDVRVIGKGPSAVTARSGSTHRRPEAKAFRYSGGGLYVGFYQNLPLLLRVERGRTESMAPVLPKSHQFVNIAGGIPQDAFKGVRTVENAVFLGDSFSFANYAHWSLDWFPRLRWILDHVPASELSIVLNKKPSAFHLQMLERVGFRRENIIHPERHTPTYLISARNIYATNLGSEFRHSLHAGAKWAMDFLKERFYDESKSPFGEGVRIVIARDSRGASVTPAASAALKRRGFLFVKPELLDHKTQVALFSNASAVIAPHGAGLSNLAYCKPGTKVLELFNGTLATHAFYTVAYFGGLDYSCAVSPSPEKPDSGKPIDTQCQIREDILDEWIFSSGL